MNFKPKSLPLCTSLDACIGVIRTHVTFGNCSARLFEKSAEVCTKGSRNGTVAQTHSLRALTWEQLYGLGLTDPALLRVHSRSRQQVQTGRVA